MPRPRRTGRVVRTAAVSLAAGVVLSGCSHEPGDAFRVGDTAVSRTSVDRVVKGNCEVVSGQGQQAPRAKLVWLTVNRMLSSTITIGYGDAIGATYDGAKLRTATSQLKDAAVKVPQPERDALVKAYSDIFKGQLLVESIGRKILAAKGAADPSDDEIVNAGTQAAQRWAEKQGITVDPRYNVGASDQAGAGDGSISKAVTTYAKRSVAGSSAPAFLGQLPKAQLCG